MKSLYTLFLLMILSAKVISQTVVYDKNHVKQITLNTAARVAADLTYHESLESIRKNTDNITLNLSSLALVETMIHTSLAEVNAAFSDAKQIKNISALLQSIKDQSSQAIELAKEEPYLLLFVDNYTNQAKERGIALAGEVASFVIAEGDNILINYNVRDELLKRIHTELAKIDKDLYVINSTMNLVKVDLFRNANPFQDYVDDDKELVDNILKDLIILE